MRKNGTCPGRRVERALPTAGATLPSNVRISVGKTPSDRESSALARFRERGETSIPFLRASLDAWRSLCTRSHRPNQ